MRHRAGVFRELPGAQAAHFADAGGLAVVQVGAEFLVAEDGQAFLQRQLEPVAAGDAVAGPVVEIFVGDDAVDVLEIDVGRDIAARQHVLRVEDVEALVLHGAHVEIADGDDHVMVEIAFEAEAFLVPVHRFLQGFHGVRALVELARLDVDGELHLAAGGGGEAVEQAVQLAGDDGEQVGRLLERVGPARPVLAVGFIAGWRPGCRWPAAPAAFPCRRAA